MRGLLSSFFFFFFFLLFWGSHFGNVKVKVQLETTLRNNAREWGGGGGGGGKKDVEVGGGRLGHSSLCGLLKRT